MDGTSENIYGQWGRINLRILWRHSNQQFGSHDCVRECCKKLQYLKKEQKYKIYVRLFIASEINMVELVYFELGCIVSRILN